MLFDVSSFLSTRHLWPDRAVRRPEVEDGTGHQKGEVGCFQSADEPVSMSKPSTPFIAYGRSVCQPPARMGRFIGRFPAPPMTGEFTEFMGTMRVWFLVSAAT